jgi:hypothetical protein
MNREIFSDSHCENIWRNNRFEHIIRANLEDPRVLETLSTMIHNVNISQLIPNDIHKEVMKNCDEKLEFDLPNNIENFESFIDILRNIRKQKKIPKNLISILTQSIRINKNLFEKLNKIGILNLLTWDFEKKWFIEAIDMNKIDNVVDKIDEDEKLKSQKLLFPDISEFQKTIDKINASKEDFELIDETDLEIEMKVDSKFSDVFGERMSKISYEDFILIKSIEEKPVITSENLRNAFLNLYPYLLQKIKMWGCNALNADYVSEMLQKKNPDCNVAPGVKTRRPKFGRKNSEMKFDDVKLNQNFEKIPLSRLDIVSGILYSSNLVVAQDIINIMVKFPMVLPLIIPDLCDMNSYIVSNIFKFSK